MRKTEVQAQPGNYDMESSPQEKAIAVVFGLFILFVVGVKLGWFNLN